MNAFFQHHKHSIRFAYRCLDRILLNAVIQPFQQPERVIGFFWAYRHLYPVSRNVLREIQNPVMVLVGNEGSINAVTRGTIWAHHIWSRARLARECNRRCRLSRKIKSGPLILIS
jgi:hypothetical protein